MGDDSLILSAREQKLLDLASGSRALALTMIPVSAICRSKGSCPLNSSPQTLRPEFTFVARCGCVTAVSRNRGVHLYALGSGAHFSGSLPDG